ncbi:tetratricopeptide repeat protein, partial [Microbispora bryophytorum]|uniref:tetratricopeptide repeat protein n=1 Tax=Microbispora bryophytorum TaxID=1460882 RepID=UPI0033FFD399
MTKRRGRPFGPLADGPALELAVSLRDLVRSSGLTLRDLAARVGSSPATISRAMKGEIVPRRELFEQLVRACGGEFSEWSSLYERAVEAVMRTAAQSASLPPRSKTPLAASLAPKPDITVAIFDDHPVVIEGVRSWLENDPQGDMRVVFTGGSLEDLSDFEGDADVVVLDPLLAGKSVIEIIPNLILKGHRVVALSSQSDNHAAAIAAIEAGADAFLSQQAAHEHLIPAIRAAAAGRPYLHLRLAEAILADRWPHRPRLSRQERNALQLWVQGMTKWQVASRMNISANTAKEYIERVRDKYNAIGRPAPSRHLLLLRALEDGIIDVADLSADLSDTDKSPSRLWPAVDWQTSTISGEQEENEYYAGVAGDPAKTRGLLKSLLRVRERAFGSQHPSTMSARADLAHSTAAAGEITRAISLYRRTLADQEMVLGENHPSTQISRLKLAAAYEMAGDFDQALSLYVRVVDSGGER